MVKTKQWKVGGKEDEMVEKLINEGAIGNSTTASALKLKNPLVFGSFSDNVVRNHLTDMKRKHGLYCMKIYYCFNGVNKIHFTFSV